MAPPTEDELDTDEVHAASRTQLPDATGGTVNKLTAASYEDHAANLGPRIIRDALGIRDPRTLARRGHKGEL